VCSSDLWPPEPGSPSSSAMALAPAPSLTENLPTGQSRQPLLQPEILGSQCPDVLGLLLVQHPQRPVQRTSHIIESLLGLGKLLGHRPDEIVQPVVHVLGRLHLTERLVVVVLRQIITDLAHPTGVTLCRRNQ